MNQAFMAGCSLSSYSPQNVQQTIAYLKSHNPKLSVIQKCCGKPTKLIGAKSLFESRFSEFLRSIKECEADELVVACQGCMDILSRTDKIKSISLWEEFKKIGLPEKVLGKGSNSDIVFSIHDACPTRSNKEIHESIRWILEQLGYKFKESIYSREKTICCGFGGMVGAVNLEIAKQNAEKCVKGFETEHIVTYCATCRSALMLGGGKSWHILDLIWGTPLHKSDTCHDNILASPVNAWINRYKTKQVINRF